MTIVSVEELDRIAEELGVESVLPEWLGANVLVKGFPELTKLPMGYPIASFLRFTVVNKVYWLRFKRGWH
ncbi:hypothetical protein [Neobacillus drentensis]|uniref:hypothetical protein n=1 Tax=Neobacillus drentensis TaxID=220684 RepID=UPI003B585CC3